MHLKAIALSVVSIENIKPLKYHMFFIKHYYVLSVIRDNWGSNDEKLFKEEESTEILEILGLIDNMEEYQINIFFFKIKIWVKKTQVKNLDWKI